MTKDDTLRTLKARFEKNMARHKGIAWEKVEARLRAKPERLRSLVEMEKTSGEPDVIGQIKKTGEYVLVDCSAESPSGRRSLCYDGEALDARKVAKPKGSAADLAAAMGVELLTEEAYR